MVFVDMRNCKIDPAWILSYTYNKSKIIYLKINNSVLLQWKTKKKELKIKFKSIVNEGYIFLHLKGNLLLFK